MPESKKIVIKVDIHDNDDKRKVLKAVSSLLGIESVTIEMKDHKLTIIGNVDPVKVTSKLKKWHAVILALGPAKEPEKKEGEKKEAEKKGEDDEAKKKKKEEEEAFIRMMEEVCRSREYHMYPPQRFCISPVDEAPIGCVIC